MFAVQLHLNNKIVTTEINRHNTRHLINIPFIAFILH